MFLKRWLVGNPLKTAQAAHQRLSKRLALAVFASDPLSSVAYATEEILLVLVPSSLAFAHFLDSDHPHDHHPACNFDYAPTPRSFSNIREAAAPTIVSKSNLGEWPGLTAAASLMIDYVTDRCGQRGVGIAAITSAIPLSFRTARYSACLPS